MMASAIDLYETMSDLSGQMVQAAQANDWDELDRLERQVATLRDTLMIQDPVSAASAQDETTRARKIALIRKILADDREIRSHAEPWMESVRNLLSGSSKQRAVNAAYGSGRGF